MADGFFKDIIKMDYGQVFITDRSSIWDFPVFEEEAVIACNIALRYGVDVTDLIERGLLGEIFERIAEERL